MNPSDYQAAGLYDPDAENAAERLALLEFLATSGVTLPDMIEAEREGVLVTTAAARVMGPAQPITLREVAERAGISEDLAHEAWRAIGPGALDPDDPRFPESDVEAFVLFRGAVEIYGKEAVLQLTRVAGSSMARITEATHANFMSTLEGPLVDEGGGELELAQELARVASVSRQFPVVMEAFYRHHWVATARRFRRARAGVAGFDSVRLAVGFVDLVGYTPLAQALPARELKEMITDFERRAFDVVTTRGGQIVKLIGDEVMFTTFDAAGACDIALELFETLGQDARITPRGGLAVGELLTRAGDYFGPVVNLASRVADLAVPHEVLVTRELRDEAEKAGAKHHFDPAGRRMLKGFGEPVELFALARA